MIKWSPSLLAQEVHCSNLGSNKYFFFKFQSDLICFFTLCLDTDISTSLHRIRNIHKEQLCTEIYGTGPNIGIYNSCFEPRRLFFCIRYKAAERVKPHRPITYPLSKWAGVSLAWVDLSWKKSGLIQYNCKILVKIYNSEI